MNSRFRWLLHKTVEENFSGLFTFSVGQENFEQVVVCKLEAILQKILSGECTHEKALHWARQKYGHVGLQNLTSNLENKNFVTRRMKTAQEPQPERVRSSKDLRSRRPDIQLYVPRARRSGCGASQTTTDPFTVSPNVTPVQTRTKPNSKNISEKMTNASECTTRVSACVPLEVNHVMQEKFSDSSNLVQLKCSPSECIDNSSELLCQNAEGFPESSESNLTEETNGNPTSNSVHPKPRGRAENILMDDTNTSPTSILVCPNSQENCEVTREKPVALGNMQSPVSAPPVVSDTNCANTEGNRTVNVNLPDESALPSTNSDPVTSFVMATVSEKTEFSSSKPHKSLMKKTENLVPAADVMEIIAENLAPAPDVMEIIAENLVPATDIMEIIEENPVPAPVVMEKSVEKESPEKSIVESGAGDSWDSLFDENGDCLHPSGLEGMKAALGNVKVQKPKIDYLVFQPQEPDLSDECYDHILELYDFPMEFKTQNLMMAFSAFKDRGFDIKWVDDTHALAIFSSPVAASEALELQSPFIKIRPVSQAISKSKFIVHKKLDYLLPTRPRPETSASLARRMIVGALGMKSHLSKEQRDMEQRKLKAAKEIKRQVAKQKRDVWNGTVS